MLAPVLLNVEDIVNQVVAGQDLQTDRLTNAFAQARDFLLESTSLFREVEETLLADDEGRQKLELCRQEMAHSLTALDKLQEATLGKKTLILRERLQSFLGSRRICNEYFGEFSRLSAQQPIYSPSPVYDAFIKAGAKVLDGHLPAERLQERFPNIMPELYKVQQQVGLLPLLHEVPQELMAALQQGLEGLQTGYGAIQNYFRTKNLIALEDGLKLIGSSSTILANQLQTAEQICSGDVRYTSFRPLEEWLRLKHYLKQNPNHNIIQPWIGMTVAQIFFVWDFLIGQAQTLLREPMLADLDEDLSLSSELVNACLAERTDANNKVAPLAGDELLNSDDSVWLAYKAKIEELSEAVEKAHQSLEQAMHPYKELPGLERIVGLKEAVKRGEQDKSLLRQEFQQQLDKVEELIASVEGAQDPISTEFREVLPVHRSAFIGMLENLEADDWEALDSRWLGVINTLPHLAGLSRAIRKRVESQSSSAKLIRCLRCGADNDPTRRVCSSCGANLPTVVQKMQTFSEINTDGGQAQALPQSNRAIDLLENLVRNVETNSVSKADSQDALQLLINDLNRQRQMFSKKLLPLMGKDEILDSYLRFFAQGLGQYFANLMEMHDACGEGSLPRLHSGLSQTRETLETLDAMKERIDGALRG